MVEEPANVARFLAAGGEATEVPPRSSGRGPPYWKSRVLRRQAFGDEDDGQGRWDEWTALVLPSADLRPQPMRGSAPGPASASGSRPE